MKLKISRAQAAKAVRGARPYLVDASGLAGLAAFLHGVHQVYAPGAWILGGLVAFVGASIFSRTKKRAP